MKKYLIHFMSTDGPTAEDDGLEASLGGGIHNKVFDSKEEAEKYLVEELIPADKAELEECYGFNEKEEGWEPTVYITVEDGMWDRKLLLVTDKFDCTELNVTVYEVIEVDF